MQRGAQRNIFLDAVHAIVYRHSPTTHIVCALCIPHFPGVKCEYLNYQSFQNSRYMHFHIAALLGIKLQSNPPFTLKQILNNFLFELRIENNYFSSLMHAVHDINHDNDLIFHDSPRLIPSQRFRVIPRL